MVVASKPCTAREIFIQGHGRVKEEGRGYGSITGVNFFANGIGISYDGGHKVGTHADSLRHISLVCYLS
jgi:hypothetical protein